MADDTPTTMTQCEDAPNHQSRKLDHMSKISSLAEGHVYALKYFPEELQVLLNTASLRYHECAPGRFGSILGWPKDSRQGSEPHSALSEHLEIRWGERDRTVLLVDRSTLSNIVVESQTMTADTDKVLSRLQRGFEFAPPFSSILTVVDEEHLIMLSAFFRYCLLLQGYETAIEGFKYCFWTWFEKLCRHIAKQILIIDPPKDVNASTLVKANPCRPADVHETKSGYSHSQFDTDERTYEDNSMASAIEAEEAYISNKNLDEELARMRKELEESKRVYEEQHKKVEVEKSRLDEIHLACVNFEAKLEAREKEEEE
ncbi:uncharacterized protein ALTATR162_LOCUS6200 [Alternaria atra]|uniref:Uncharacterized protein n=1 Tax=Alternaria atra TaxID=119953 RepID=A0A8J2I393_9PLEO|nr:uncharacterized protein ALTATR162_LOCUS6200 [Alternaria atra]CAG5162331.1 unnamed protein product [Alternaria atra]